MVMRLGQTLSNGERRRTNSGADRTTSAYAKFHKVQTAELSSGCDFCGRCRRFGKSLLTKYYMLEMKINLNFIVIRCETYIRCLMQMDRLAVEPLTVDGLGS